MNIPVEEIKQGDRFVADGFLHWTALGDAAETFVLDSDDEPLIGVSVQFADGGIDVRVWDPGMTIEIER